MRKFRYNLCIPLSQQVDRQPESLRGGAASVDVGVATDRFYTLRLKLLDAARRIAGGWREVAEHVRYRVDNIFAGGSLAQFLLLAVLVALVILLGTSAIFLGLFGKENEQVVGIRRGYGAGPIDALWWAASHLFDPAYFSTNYGASAAVVAVSLAISISGMVLFGMLIGFISTAIEQRLEALRLGNSPVKERDHLLILGWSSKLFTILEAMAELPLRQTIVVCADREAAQMRELLGASLDRSITRRVILRSGPTQTISDLERMAFDRARGIIVLSDETRGSSEDLAVVKRIKLLNGYRDWRGDRPRIAAEIARKENVAVAEIAGRGSIPVLSTSEIVSRILVQASRQPGLARLYESILSFKGSGIDLRMVPQAAGKRFRDILLDFPDAIPLGISELETMRGPGVPAPRLAPMNDWIGEDSAHILLMPADGDAYRPEPAPPAVDDDAIRTRVSVVRERYLILGWNDNIYEMLSQYDQYLRVNSEIVIVSAFDNAEAQRRIADQVREPFSNIHVTCIERDYQKREVLNRLSLDDFHGLTVLADSTSASAEDADSRTIMTLLLLDELQRRRPANARVHVVAEILDPRNRDVLEDTDVRDVIVSSDLISRMLAQISRQQMLKLVYDELLSPGGVEIYLKPAGRYARLRTPTSFRSVIAAARDLGEIAIGVSVDAEARNRETSYGIYVNPRKDDLWMFDERDRVAVIADSLW